MNEKKLHLVNGKWEKCTATKRACRYRTHANNMKEAQKISDKFNENQMIIDKESKYWTNGYMARIMLKGESVYKVFTKEECKELLLTLGLKDEDMVVSLVNKSNIRTLYKSLKNKEFEKEILETQRNLYEHDEEITDEEFEKYLDLLKADLENDRKKLYRISETTYAYPDMELGWEEKKLKDKQYDKNQDIIFKNRKYDNVSKLVYLDGESIKNVLPTDDYLYFKEISSKDKLPIISSIHFEDYQKQLKSNERLVKLSEISYAFISKKEINKIK